MAGPAIPVPIGGLELFLLFTVGGVLAGIWVFIDARRRGADHPALWAISVGFLFLFYFVVGLAALVVYVVMREHLGGEPTDPAPVHEHDLEE